MKKVHLIGNAHLDPAWLWAWQEGYTEVLSTFRSALDRMKEKDNYIFTCAGAAYYQWVEETDPEMFEEIRQRVKEGRWAIVGGWWIQPDCNLPAGESFVRQGLYSQRYYKEKFGRMAEVGYNVDSFGHCAMLPQILKQSNLNAYVYMRPTEGPEKHYPFAEPAFLWEGADGTRIRTYRIPGHYSTGPFGQSADEAKKSRELAKEVGLPVMCFYGVGNHGGGPTRENLKALEELLASQEGGDYGYSSPDAYFAAISEEELPLLQGDLQNHASGCYTALMSVKDGNRKAEASLITAEKYSVMAKLLGVKKEIPNFSETWKTLLFNQFHDILSGCCIRSVYEETSKHEFGECIAEGNRGVNRALQAIAWNIDTMKGLPPVGGKYEFRLWNQEDRGTPAVVFNPYSWPAEFPVRFHADAKSATDNHGNFIPVQRVRAEMINESEKYETIANICIPAMGWKLFWLYEHSKEDEIGEQKMLKVSKAGLENTWTKMEIDPTTGGICHFSDREWEKVLINEPTCERIVDESDSDTWAH